VQDGSVASVQDECHRFSTACLERLNDLVPNSGLSS
jgi:hypothetical protein